MLRMTCPLFLLLITAASVTAQTDEDDRRSSVAVTLGVPMASGSFPSIPILTRDYSPYILMPVFAGNAEFRYRLATLYGCSFSGTVSAGFATLVPRGPIGVSFTMGVRSEIDGRISRIPLLAGVRIESQTILSPFITTGAGIASTRYVHTVPGRSDLSFDTSAVQYCWMVSGGLRFRSTGPLSYEFVVMSWFTEKPIMRTLPMESIGITGRFAVTTVGFSAVYHL